MTGGEGRWLAGFCIPVLGSTDQAQHSTTVYVCWELCRQVLHVTPQAHCSQW